MCVGCNLNAREKTRFNVYAHNLSGFDGNFFIKAFEKYRTSGINFPQERLDLEGVNKHKYENTTVKLGKKKIFSKKTSIK